MISYLAEKWLPGLDVREVAEIARALHQIAERMTSSGCPVDYVSSCYVASEGRWLGVLRTTDLGVATRVLSLAQLPSGTICEVLVPE